MLLLRYCDDPQHGLGWDLLHFEGTNILAGNDCDRGICHLLVDERGSTVAVDAHGPSSDIRTNQVAKESYPKGGPFRCDDGTAGAT